ncbi:MAG: hypothetical protein ABSE73_12495 [Planctomycetota bacterium]
MNTAQTKAGGTPALPAARLGWRRRLRLYILRGLLACGSIVIGRVICEVALRVLNIPPQDSVPPELKVHLAEFGRAHNFSLGFACYPPNITVPVCTSEFQTFNQTDNLGYVGVGKPKAEARPLLVFGDSFAYGYGVNAAEAIAAQLDAYNAGLWGTSFPLHARALERVAGVFKPKRALWILYPPHLITVCKNKWRARGVVDPVDHPCLAWGIGLYNRTRLSLAIMSATGWGFNRDDYFTLEWSLYDPADTLVDSGFDAFEQAAADVAKVARRANIQIIPVFIPSKAQLALALDGKRPVLLHRSAALDPSLAVRRMQEILARQGIGPECHIDVLELFRSGSLPWREAYFPIDAHLNAKGSRAVAQFLAEKLKALPPP